MTPMQKLLSCRKVPKSVAIFPVMNLDTIGANMHLFFPNKSQPSGGYVLTKDLLPLTVHPPSYSIFFIK